ncbi:MAG: ASKHA domain-containing protein [Terrimicrobiaceae bacterium]
MKSTAEIEVESGGRTRRLKAGGLDRTLAEILSSAGFPLNTRCSQRGLCRGCHVILEGNPPRDLLACQHRLGAGESIRIAIPGRSLLSHPPSVVSDFQTGVPSGSDPIFTGSGTLGVALDIGTTTVAMLLAELASGKVLAKATALNAQVARGDNVLTRIHLCQTDKTNIGLLKDDFWEKTFRPLLGVLFEESGATISDVAGVVVAGNTTMLHIACGADPTPLGTVPFTPAFLDQREFTGDLFGLPRAVRVIFLPGISAYVGADISAGAACCGVRYGTGPQLLVDVGTNGEILLCGPKGNLSCATAAGPAFEGCGLLCGMRAARGVVGKISMKAEPFGVGFETIGGPCASPHGITGSAYVDFLAEGRRAGLLLENGRFDRRLVASHPAHFRQEENGLSFLLSPGLPDLRVGEVDVALLLQAKGAIAAGIETLLALQSLPASGIDRLFLAGGFGLHLSIPNAIACGLLPGFTAGQISAVGNTSLGGAYLAMLDRSLAAEMADLDAATIELNLDPGFEDRYLDHLSLP